MKLAAFILIAAMFSATAGAATITVTITGTTGEIRVGEGPIFEHRSYTLIPPGDPFSLTYTFDEEKGKQTISELSNGLISQSEIENTKLSSPGTSATLQIGRAVWEFGSSTRSQVVMKTSATSKSEQFVYIAQAGGNRVSAQIVPGKGGYWPKNGDWRASFTSGPLDGSTASFAADNDRVSASGSLTPLTIAVAGVDIDGQWLRYATNRRRRRQVAVGSCFAPRRLYRGTGNPHHPGNQGGRFAHHSFLREVLAGVAGSCWSGRSRQCIGQLPEYSPCRKYWGGKRICGGAFL